MKVIRTLTFKSLSGKKLSLPQLWSWKPRFTFWNYPQLNFFKLSFMFFFLSKSSIQHMSLNFLMGSAETGNKTSASKLQVGSKHSHNVFQIIKLEAKVPDHFHISFRVFWLLEHPTTFWDSKSHFELKSVENQLNIWRYRNFH